MMSVHARSPAASRRPAWVIAGALVTLVVALAGAGAASTKYASKPLYWGAQIGPQLTGTQAPWDMRAVYKFQHIAHKAPSLISFYVPFADCTVSPCNFYGFPTEPMEKVRQYGAVPFLNWSSAAITGREWVHQPAFSLRRIIDGTYDTHIRAFAEQAADWNWPFFLRFDWEMNGFWFPWNEGVNGNKPGEFVVAWRHVHDIFTEAGATNATWVWCPNIALVKRLKKFRPLYPGNAHVDWTCIDGFNWGNTRYSAGWMSFNQVFHSTYRTISQIAPQKPMIVGETASDERGGSKAHWIRDTLRIVPSRYRKIRGLIWFNEKWRGMNWPIESSRSSRRAFARGIGRKVYRPNRFWNLPPGPIRPPGRR